MNASSQREYYMTGGEIAKAISDVSTLTAEVIKHSSNLRPVHGTAYQPRGMTPQFLRVKRAYHGSFSGYDFSENGDSSELIVPYGNEILIATHRQRRSQYELHTLSDYVSLWVIDDKDRLISGDHARQDVQNVLSRMKQLLPEGHPLKAADVDEAAVEEFASYSSER